MKRLDNNHPLGKKKFPQRRLKLSPKKVFQILTLVVCLASISQSTPAYAIDFVVDSPLLRDLQAKIELANALEAMDEVGGGGISQKLKYAVRGIVTLLDLIKIAVRQGRAGVSSLKKLLVLLYDTTNRLVNLSLFALGACTSCKRNVSPAALLSLNAPSSSKEVQVRTCAACAFILAELGRRTKLYYILDKIINQMRK